MKDLKFKYLKITFKDGVSKEFFTSDIEHIETNANSTNFVVRIFINDIKAFHHMDEYFYEINQIKEVEQRWEANNDKSRFIEAIKKEEPDVLSNS